MDSTEEISSDATSQSKSRIILPKGDQIKNVHTSFIREHGKTPGCLTCTKDTFHGRVHNKKRIERFKNWLDKQRDLPSSSIAPSSSISEPPRRLTSKQPRPPQLVEPDVPLSVRFPDASVSDLRESSEQSLEDVSKVVSSSVQDPRVALGPQSTPDCCEHG